MKPDEVATILSEYAKGGAEYIKEIRETSGRENNFDNEDDFRNYILDRYNYIQINKYNIGLIDGFYI